MCHYIAVMLAACDSLSSAALCPLLSAYDDCRPVVLVLLGAVLYATEVVVQLSGDGPGLAVFAECIAHASVKVVDI